jgi:hypothetical protein
MAIPTVKIRICLKPLPGTGGVDLAPAVSVSIRKSNRLDLEHINGVAGLLVKAQADAQSFL